MKLIVTRPAEDCAGICEALRGRGHSVVAAPLMQIMPRPDAVVPALPFQAVCFTSANAARHVPSGVSRRLSAFTVGAQSAAAAALAGFGHIEAKGGDVAGMAANVIRALKPEHGPVLYVSGQETSGDLASTLRAAGFQVTRVVAYDAVPQALGLSAAGVAECHGVLLYSRRTAGLWVEALQKLEIFPRLSHFCLSPQIATALPPQWRLRVATEPTEAALLALIDLAAK